MPPKKEAKKPPSEDDTVRDARARPAAPAVPGCDASSARQDENRRKLWYAAEKGEAEVVSEFIAKGVKVNWKNPDAVSGLASPRRESARARGGWGVGPSRERGRRARVRARVGARPAQAGSTPLYMSAQGGHVEVAQLLIDAGAELNLIAKNEVRAARRPRASRRAIPARCNVCSACARRAQFGHTPLYWAAYNGHPDMVRLLLDNKANKKLADKVGQKPIDMACRALPVGMTREKNKAEILALLR